MWQLSSVSQTLRTWSCHEPQVVISGVCPPTMSHSCLAPKESQRGLSILLINRLAAIPSLLIYLGNTSSSFKTHLKHPFLVLLEPSSMHLLGPAQSASWHQKPANQWMFFYCPIYLLHKNGRTWNSKSKLSISFKPLSPSSLFFQDSWGRHLMAAWWLSNPHSVQRVTWYFAVT